MAKKKKTYKLAKEKNLKIIDLTCPKILKIREKIAENKDKKIILLIGKKSHPEIVANISWCGKNSYAIENEEDINLAYENFKEINLKDVYVISQTTFLSTKFDALSEIIKEKFKSFNICENKTICPVTESRQKEAEDISKKVDIMIVIGSKNSSNTKELFNISSKNCKHVYLTQDISDIDTIDFKENYKVGIIAGASTPNELIDEVKQKLYNY